MQLFFATILISEEFQNYQVTIAPQFDLDNVSENSHTPETQIANLSHASWSERIEILKAIQMRVQIMLVTC